MKQYKTLKDLPGIPFGTIGFQNGDMIVFLDRKFPLSTHQLPIKYINEYPDFFQEVEEEKEKRFTLSDMNSAYNAGYNRLITFGSFISKNFPHTKIDQ